MNPGAIRLLVVDDHPVVRDGLRSVQDLAPEIAVVGEAGGVEAAVEAARRLEPHVVLLDIRLQGGSGVDVCRQLKSQRTAPRVIFLTSYADEQLIMAALEAGADGYLLKENDTRRVVDAIMEVMRGGSVFDAQVTRTLADQRREGTGRRLGPLANLTAQERRLLEEVSRGKTDKEVAAALGLSAKTARNYLDRVFTKLGVHNRTEAAMLYVRAVAEHPNQ